MTVVTDRRWRTCARPGCDALFLVPGDREPNALYCSDACKRRETSAVQRAAWTELARRHRGELLEIRAQIRKARRA
jgi:hypothetical protein